MQIHAAPTDKAKLRTFACLRYLCVALQRVLILAHRHSRTRTNLPMLVSLLSSLAFIAVSQTEARNVRHSFAAEQIDCVDGGPRSHAEQEEIVREWRGAGILHVEFWGSESGSRYIDRNWSQARLKNDRLIVSYRLDDVEYGPDDPILGCSFPVRIKFDFFGLPRQPYKLYVEVVSAASHGTIDD